MKLYFSKGACSLGVRITINELGMSCDYESVDLKTKKTSNGTDFLTINPKGAVPVLELDDKTILTENATIQQYLAESKKADRLLPAIGQIARYRVLEWLNFVATDLHKGTGIFFSTAIPDQLKDDFFRPMLVNKLKIVEQQLTKHSYIAGDQFTISDSYLFVILSWLPYTKIEIKDFPKISHYFDNVKQRDSVIKSLKEEGLM